MDWTDTIATLLWRGSWAAVPFILLVAAICKWAPCRPGTRHVLWLITLGSFLAPLLGLALPVTGPAAPAPPPPVSAVFPEKSATDDRTPVELVFVADDDQLLSLSDAPEADALTTEEAALILDVLTELVSIERRNASESATESESLATAARETDAKVNSWSDGLARVRSALLGLPRLPAGCWLIGLAGLTVYYVFGAARFRLRLRRSESAPRAVTRMVERVCRRIGLRRPPATVMLDEPVSPLVWCGRRTRLVLPKGLWAELDPIGRQAILCHELAHLQRRDHWIRRAELLLSALYWWNPLVWWIRRRVEEEADHCCDAWVTWLMPRRRRAYAEALLATRAYVGAGARGAPAIVMGATSPRSKCFARRIKMVMTHSSRPGLSVTGIGLAVSLLFVGWIVTPAWSRPSLDPRDDSYVSKTHLQEIPVSCAVVCEKTAGGSGTTACLTTDACVVAGGDSRADRNAVKVYCAPQTEKTCTVVANADGRAPIAWTGAEQIGDGEGVIVVMGDDGKRTVKRHVTRHVEGDEELEARLEKLEQAMEKLNRLLEKRGVYTYSSASPTPPAQPAKPSAPEVPSPPKTGARIWKDGNWSSLPGQDPGLALALRKTKGADEPVAREYNLPAGKLEALTALMARADVPVLISPGAGSITLHATPQQHRIFEAFVNLIHPSDKEDGESADAVRVLIGAPGEEGTAIYDSTGVIELSDVFLDELPRAEFRKAKQYYVQAMEDAADALESAGRSLPPRKQAVGEDAKVRIEVEKRIKDQAERKAAQAKDFQDQQHQAARELERTMRELERQARQLQQMAEEMKQRMEEKDAER